MSQFQEMAKEMLKEKVVFQNEKLRRNYVMDSDRAFQKFAKQIGNDYSSYFELVNDGVYKLRKKWYPKRG